MRRRECQGAEARIFASSQTTCGQFPLAPILVFAVTFWVLVLVACGVSHSAAVTYGKCSCLCREAANCASKHGRHELDGHAAKADAHKC